MSEKSVIVIGEGPVDPGHKVVVAAMLASELKAAGNFERPKHGEASVVRPWASVNTTRTGLSVWVDDELKAADWLTGTERDMLDWHYRMAERVLSDFSGYTVERPQWLRSEPMLRSWQIALVDHDTDLGAVARASIEIGQQEWGPGAHEHSFMVLHPIVDRVQEGSFVPFFWACTGWYRLLDVPPRARPELFADIRRWRARPRRDADNETRAASSTTTPARSAPDAAFWYSQVTSSLSRSPPAQPAAATSEAAEAAPSVAPRDAATVRREVATILDEAVNALGRLIQGEPENDVVREVATTAIVSILSLDPDNR